MDGKNITNSKIVLGSVGMICVATISCFVTYLKLRPARAHEFMTSEYNHCLQIAMSESRQSGKIIDIKEAKSVCDVVESRKKN